MKKFNHIFICILICLAPALLAGQALQVQNQLPGISSPTTDLIRNNFRLTDPPILRLSHEGPTGLEMIKIELIPLSLQSTGPILLLNQQDPMMPGDGSISLLPNHGGSQFSIRNIGSSGQDGVRLNVACPPVHNSFFDIFYDLPMGKLTQAYGDPDFDLLRITTFDKATPKLHEHIASNNTGMSSFFDVFYDLPMGKITQAYGDPDFDLLRITTFDKATPKLHEHIASNNTGMSSFFDVFYDLPMGKITQAYGDPDFDLLRITTFDKATPKLSERISSNSIALDSFFDVFYDLSLATTGVGFGFDPDDLCLVHRFENNPPRLHSKVQSSDPLYVDSFFDITYDLDLGSIKTEHNHNAFTVMSSEPATICWKFESMLPATPDFFDICYDMEHGIQKTEYGDLVCAVQYSESDLDFSCSYSSNLPATPGFFDITYDISLADLLTHSTRAGIPGTAPLEMRYEYDALSRKIKEICIDEFSGTTLSLERRLSPTGSSLFVSSKLEIEGEVSTPGGGPLVLADNVLINGAAHQINGMLAVSGPAHQISGMVTVNGDLHVNGTLSATNKLFKIDHPLDPDNKYLVHSCIESPDMMNIYNGNAITDEWGYVTILLPAYFEALNKDFRYQLTCIGEFAQAIVAAKIKDNKFLIRTDKPNVEVSWQVTGIRHDPAALQNQYAVEMVKPVEEEGCRKAITQAY